MCALTLCKQDAGGMPGNSEVEGVLLPGNRVDGLAEKWWELMSWSVQALEKNFQT